MRNHPSIKVLLIFQDRGLERRFYPSKFQLPSIL